MYVDIGVTDGVGEFEGVEVGVAVGNCVQFVGNGVSVAVGVGNGSFVGVCVWVGVTIGLQKLS